MAVTMMNNMINPEVMGDMINAKVEAQAKLTKTKTERPSNAPTGLF